MTDKPPSEGPIESEMVELDDTGSLTMTFWSDGAIDIERDNYEDFDRILLTPDQMERLISEYRKRHLQI